MKEGLRPRTEDVRDFKVGQAFTLPKLSELPDEFEIPVPDEWILDQGDTDTCAGHAAAVGSSLQEGVLLDPLFSWVMARNAKGMNDDEWGLELRDILRAHVKFGAIEKSDAPFTASDTGWRNITKWDV